MILFSSARMGAALCMRGMRRRLELRARWLLRKLSRIFWRGGPISRQAGLGSSYGRNDCPRCGCMQNERSRACVDSLRQVVTGREMRRSKVGTDINYSANTFVHVVQRGREEEAHVRVLFLHALCSWKVSKPCRRAVTHSPRAFLYCKQDGYERSRK